MAQYPRSRLRPNDRHLCGRVAASLGSPRAPIGWVAHAQGARSTPARGQGDVLRRPEGSQEPSPAWNAGTRVPRALPRSHAPRGNAVCDAPRRLARAPRGKSSGRGASKTGVPTRSVGTSFSQLLTPSWITAHSTVLALGPLTQKRARCRDPDAAEPQPKRNDRLQIPDLGNIPMGNGKSGIAQDASAAQSRDRFGGVVTRHFDKAVIVRSDAPRCP
jgi:hypothetical protein